MLSKENIKVSIKIESFERKFNLILRKYKLDKIVFSLMGINKEVKEKKLFHIICTKNQNKQKVTLNRDDLCIIH